MTFFKGMSRFSSLLLLLAFVTFFTACQKEELVQQDAPIDEVITTSGNATDLAGLPYDPQEILEAANNSNSEIVEGENQAEDRACQLKLFAMNCYTATYRTSPQFAFWVYHYAQDGSFRGWSRSDVPTCNVYFNRPYIVVGGRYRSVGFVGYQSNGTKTVICP